MGIRGELVGYVNAFLTLGVEIAARGTWDGGSRLTMCPRQQGIAI